MLINLSNHPVSTWSDQQLQAANELFGEVVDVPIPAVPPTADVNEVYQLAFDTVSHICQQYKGHPFAVHIMGELSFTYAAVQEFLLRDVECVVSTSQRKVFSMENGEKISQFQFVKFRSYLDQLKSL